MSRKSRTDERESGLSVSGLAATSMQAYLAAIVESAQDAIFSKNSQAIIQTWNRAAERLYGYSAEEIVGKSASLIIPPDGAGEERRLLDRVLRGEPIDHVETHRARKDGNRVEVSESLVPIHDAAGRIVGAASISHDITETKRAQRHVTAVAAVSHALGEAHLDQEAMLSVMARKIAAASGDSAPSG